MVETMVETMFDTPASLAPSFAPTINDSFFGTYVVVTCSLVPVFICIGWFCCLCACHRRRLSTTYIAQLDKDAITGEYNTRFDELEDGYAEENDHLVVLYTEYNRVLKHTTIIVTPLANELVFMEYLDQDYDRANKRKLLEHLNRYTLVSSTLLGSTCMEGPRT